MSELRTHSDLIPAARKEGDAVIVSVRGEIDLQNSPELRTELLDLLVKHSPQRLVLNLAQVPYMDSSAIAVLVELLQKIRKNSGRVYLTNLQPRVKGLLETLQREKPKRLILNLAGVPYMDSSAIAVLVESLQKIRKIGGKIYLTNLQPRVKGLLEIARLDAIFVLTASEEEAMSK